jgi:histidine triad (HIT) family protein
MDDPCVFCQIIAGEVKAKIIYRNDMVTVFEDVKPIAPTHLLIVPNKHIHSINEVEPNDTLLLAQMFLIARDMAKEAGISESGYRLMINTGENGRQTVFHLHMHLIGGKKLLGRLAVNV